VRPIGDQTVVDGVQQALSGGKPLWGRHLEEHAGSYVKTYTIDVNTSRTPKESAHSPSWQNRLVIIINRKDAHSLSWPNGLIIIIIIIYSFIICSLDTHKILYLGSF
jgi:hypothetical protein